jgi:hypothetical protein
VPIKFLWALREAVFVLIRKPIDFLLEDSGIILDAYEVNYHPEG